MQSYTVTIIPQPHTYVVFAPHQGAAIEQAVHLYGKDGHLDPIKDVEVEEVVSK